MVISILFSVLFIVSIVYVLSKFKNRKQVKLVRVRVRKY